MPTQQEMSAWAEAQYLREKLAKLEGQLPKHNPTSTATTRYEGQQKQAAWQEAFEAHGRVVPPQREGEATHLYNLRLASAMQEYSPEWKTVNLHEAPSFMVDRVLGEIKADALKPESHRADVPAGQIKEIHKRDQSGRKYTEFLSSDGRTTFISQLNALNPRRIISKMYGVDKIGGSSHPIERLQNVGRQRLHHGLPRSP